MERPLYVPILKWKKGEQEALKNLTAQERSKIIPLLEIVDYQEPDTIFENVTNSFDGPVYIDTAIAGEDDRDYLILILDEFNKGEKTAYPVLYFNDFDESEDFITSIVDRLAVRISLPEDIDGEGYKSIFQRIKDFYTKHNTLFDIILDLDIISEKADANKQFREVKDVLNQYLLNQKFYNSIIISSTSFPKNISSIPAGENASYIRYDIKLFLKLLEYPQYEKLKLIFSDYGVTKFTETDLDFSKMKHRPLPKVKYTTNDNYIVLKGARNTSTRAMIRDYSSMAKEVVSSSYYFGNDFSFGDNYLYEKANKLTKGPGGPANWVTAVANHHIAVVVAQLSKIL